jgi:hypothetical protein
MKRMKKVRIFLLLGAVYLFSNAGLQVHGIDNENCRNNQNEIGERTFPILAWIGPPARLLTDAAWDDMARAGFSLCNTLTFFDSVSNKKALALGEKYGIGIILRDNRYHYSGKPLEKSGIEKAVLQWMNEPAFAGYSVKDEPGAKDFKELTRIKKIITGIDNSHRVYVNLFPDYASDEQLGKSTYLKYVKSFMRKFKPGVLSYDHYCIRIEEERETVGITYYENLEVIRTAAIEAKVPFSAFTLSIPHWSYPVPTEGHIRFQLYSDLVYGAKELQYFTYGSVESIPDFGDALIDSAGNTTATYDLASKINWEIQHMAPVLLDLESTDVFHTSPQPSGTKAFTGHGGLTACSGGPAVLGFFDDSEGQKWLMVVNRNPFAPVLLTLTFAAGIDSVGEVNKTTSGGIVNKVALVNQQLILPLSAGDGRLFRIGK